MVAVMLAAKALGANQGKSLKYLNSGDVTGERSRVVGYAAAVFYEGGWKDGRDRKKRKKWVWIWV